MVKTIHITEKAENIELFVHLNKDLFSVVYTVVMIWWAVCLAACHGNFTTLNQ